MHRTSKAKLSTLRLSYTRALILLALYRRRSCPNRGVHKLRLLGQLGHSVCMTCYKVWPYKCTSRWRKFDITNAAMGLLVDHTKKLHMVMVLSINIVQTIAVPATSVRISRSFLVHEAVAQAYPLRHVSTTSIQRRPYTFFDSGESSGSGISLCRSCSFAAFQFMWSLPPRSPSRQRRLSGLGRSSLRLSAEPVNNPGTGWTPMTKSTHRSSSALPTLLDIPIPITLDLQSVKQQQYTRM